MQFSDRLREQREELGIKQKDMAKKLNLPANTYNGYETGKRTPPLDVIVEISEILGVTTDYLLGKTDIINPEVTFNPPQKEVETIAAHLDDKDITPKKMKMIQDYIDLLFDDEE